MARHKTTKDQPQTGSAPPAGHAYPYPWVRLRSASGHALLYQRMLGSVDPAARPGDIVAVYDKSNRFFGHAFYHDRSQIALRMLSYGPEAIDEQFFRRRLAEALAWRQQLLGHAGTSSRGPGGAGSRGPEEPDVRQRDRGNLLPQTDAGDKGTDVYRLVHAEGDGLSGLIAERYADCIAIEVFSLGIYRRLEMFKRLLGELTGIGRFVVRADERIERIEGFRVSEADSSAVPETVIVREHGLRFRVDLRRGHKTGFFCDQRDNRRRLAELARGADLLDVCCYTGGFGIYARALGGAEAVTGVDLDEEAIELARRNANLNQLRIQHVHADAFAYLRQMQTNGRSFDIVVLDPPKFIASRDEQAEGARKYLDLNTLGMSVLRPGGLLLTCSCSGLVSRDDFLDMVKAAANRVRRPLQIADLTGAAPDHPVMANCPEGAYLKAVWARVL